MDKQITFLFFVFLLILCSCGCIQDISRDQALSEDIFPGASGDMKYDGSYSFVIYGDSRSNHYVHSMLYDDISKHDPEFVIHTGDMVNTGTEQEWDSFKEIVLSRNITLYPCVGNHEYSPNKGLYNYYKTFPEFQNYYRFAHKDVTFIVLDTCRMDSIQLEWLETKLNNSRDTIIVIGHHPVCMLRSRSSPENVDKLHDLFVAYGVYMYVSGHEHYYYQTERDNVLYVITGGGGAPLHQPNVLFAKPGDTWIKAYHYLLFTITKNNEISMEVIEI